MDKMTSVIKPCVDALLHADDMQADDISVITGRFPDKYGQQAGSVRTWQAVSSNRLKAVVHL